MKNFLLGVLMLFLSTSCLLAQTFYVSTTGNDSNPGTIDSSFLTIAKGIAVATTPGTTIYVRGGTYAITATLTLSRSGSSASRYMLYAYPGERPLIDAVGAGSGSRGIRVSGSYWHVKGFDVWRAPDNGMNISGSNNIIEFCRFSENGDTGLQIGGGGANNRIINCDSYFNVDATQGNADGFAPKLDVGTGNYFYGCRSWQNSDDGWDGYMRPSDNVTTTLENCWCFMNGYLKTGVASSGNGNGYKMGGGDNSNADSLRHNMILKNCLSFDNRVKGYDQNNNRGSMTLLNCTAFRNGTNYQISSRIRVTAVLTVENCVALGAYGSLGSFAVQATNSWMPPFVVTNGDFVSIDTTGVRGPRQADGSLPEIQFMHLAAGSDLIDAGTNVGLPFNGSAPDLGCFETDGVNAVKTVKAIPAQSRLEQNYPNPFNPETSIGFSVERTGRAAVTVYDLLGKKVATLFDGFAEAGLHYTVQFNPSSFPSGVYFYQLQSGSRLEVKKLTYIR
jgi:hypothetical protein